MEVSPSPLSSRPGFLLRSRGQCRVCAFPRRKAHDAHQRHKSQQESGGAYPDFLLHGSTTGNVCGSPLESRMKSTEDTVLDRKSGGAEGPAVRPGSRTKFSLPLVLPQNRHPEGEHTIPVEFHWRSVTPWTPPKFHLSCQVLWPTAQSKPPHPGARGRPAQFAHPLPGSAPVR